MTRREVNESPVYQGSDETIAYTIDFADWGTPSSPVVTLKEKESGTDKTATNLSGSASASGDVVTTKAVHSLTKGTAYVLLCTVTISGNTKSAYLEIVCDQF